MKTMPKFNAAQAIELLAIYQLLGEWANEIDKNQGVGVGPLLTDDCAYNLPANSYRGRSNVVAYYKARVAELSATPQGIPVQRHVLANLRVEFTSAEEAKVGFVMTYFTGLSASCGNSPADPALVGDGDMIVRREGDGDWRIARLDTAVAAFRANAVIR
jgi:hypothetical protein